MIVSTGVPTGVLRTTRQYENFILELEWRHVHEGGNAGVFIHSGALPVTGQPFTKAIEFQVILSDHPEGIATRHGDVFAIQGATMTPDRPHPRGWMRSLPSARRVKPAGEWNHYRIESRDGQVSLSVNGKRVSGGFNCVPRKGYICLESEGSECHFRNVRLLELPTSDPPDNQVAETDQQFKSIYTGVDLAGWWVEDGHKGHWRPKDWVLDYDGKSQAKDPTLWTEKEYVNFEMIVDWRLPRKPVLTAHPVIAPSGLYETNADGARKTVEVLDAGDSGIYLRGNTKSQVNIWCLPVGSGEVYGYREDASLPAEVRAAVTPKVRADHPPGQWNRFHITMRGDRLTVVLNGQKVIDEAALPNVPNRGRIGLQHHGDPVQFANPFVREIPTR
jgi:hypothetical protein